MGGGFYILHFSFNDWFQSICIKIGVMLWKQMFEMNSVIDWWALKLKGKPFVGQLNTTIIFNFCIVRNASVICNSDAIQKSKWMSFTEWCILNVFLFVLDSLKRKCVKMYCVYGSGMNAINSFHARRSHISTFKRKIEHEEM